MENEETKKNKDELRGTERSLFVCNGAIGHALEDRVENDFYATDPRAAELLLELEPQLNNIYECAVGKGHLAEVFRKAGKLRAISDLIDRGYYPEGIRCKYGLDFMTFNKVWKGDIVTNPPFCEKNWIQHSLNCLTEGRYLVLFMKIQCLEGKARRQIFDENPPIRVWVSSSRIRCARNGEESQFARSSAACYCWYVWQKGYKGPTELKWFN